MASDPMTSSLFNRLLMANQPSLARSGYVRIPPAHHWTEQQFSELIDNLEHLKTELEQLKQRIEALEHSRPS